MTKRSKTGLRSPKHAPPAAVVTPERPRANIVAALCLALAACVLYASSWHYGFAGDDSFVIERNLWTGQGLSALPDIVSHSLYFGAVPVNGGLYRPAAGAYYAIVGGLVGLRPAGYHIAQILLYGLNTALVFLFFTCLTRRSIALPVVATLLFIAHPIHTEIVNNIKSADEILCLGFFLTSAIAWLTYADTAHARWRYISIGAYVLAVCSKETAVPMALALPALWYFFRERPARASLVAAMPFAAVAALYLVARYAVLSSEPATNIVTLLNNSLLATSDRSVQFATALTYLTKYAQMLVWPHPLSFDYSYNALPLHTFRDPAVWAAITLFGGLGAILVAGFRRRRVEAFAVLWFATSMVIVSNVFFLISTNFGERLLYLPSVLICYVAARLLFKAAQIAEDRDLASALRAPLVSASLVVVLSAAGFAVIVRTREWRDQMTLFGADVAKYPNSARLNNYLGNLYYFAGDALLTQHADPDGAAVDFASTKTYLLHGLGILDVFQEMHAVLGMAEFRLKEYQNAIPHLERALAFKGYRTQALEMMADAYDQLGMSDQALQTFKQIDAEGIQYPRAWFELGNDAAAHGDDDASLRYFGRVIAASPDNAQAHFNLAMAQYRKGDAVQSLASLERCIALKTGDTNQASCLLLAADILARTGHRDQALSYFAQAKAIDPNHPWIKGGGSPIK